MPPRPASPRSAPSGSVPLGRRRPARLPGRLALVGALLLAGLGQAGAAKTFAEYRYFRALSIDLGGRVPTRDEIAAFETDDGKPGGWLDQWLDQRLAGPAYANRIERIYMDLLRLQVGTNFQFVPGQSLLRRQVVKGPDGQDLYVYFRDGQRRQNPVTDGTFCLSQAQTGLQFPRNTAATGTPHPVAQADLDAATVVVKPWWLYRDYRAANPTNLYDPAAWSMSVPGYVPAPALLADGSGANATTVRVCREEAGAPDNGTVYASGRARGPMPGAMPPDGRLDFPPVDTSYAAQNAGKPIACRTTLAMATSADCGCGPGLERCMPSPGPNFETPAFTFPSRYPLGDDQPFDQATQGQSSWERLYWGQEALRFLDYVLSGDRDFREVLTGRYTFVNGPLAQFYREIAPASCCGQGASFGYLEADPLVDPASLPVDLLPHDASTWKLVADRGPHASGLLTMPVFLTKYGTRRARAHVLYQAFQCKDFVAGNIELKPSTEPDLMKRDGCNICHATLEPMAAYFTRIQESSWVWLPAASFPSESAKCAVADLTKMSTACKTYYDPAFTSATVSKLRGAYASESNADAGPAGIAASLVGTSQFERCVAQNVAGSFLGRSLTSDDDVLAEELARTFASGGYKMRALVKALVKSDAYRLANNVSSSLLRAADGGQP